MTGEAARKEGEGVRLDGWVNAKERVWVGMGLGLCVHFFDGEKALVDGEARVLRE